MNRLPLALLLVLTISLPGSSAPVPLTEKQPARKIPSPEEIKKAIVELGSPRFPVRERASKLLWEAGGAAEQELEQAEKSKDEETASRARSILDKFRWGLYPDTAEEIRKLIDQFRDGDAAQRQETLGALMRLNPIPFSVLRKLMAREDNPEAREQMFIRLSNQIRDAIPGVLTRGDMNSAEDLLEMAVAGSALASASDFAAFMYLRGKLDASITRFEKEFEKKGKEREHAAQVLAHLYRVKGDWKAARRAAEASENKELVEMLLWEAVDWKGLSALDANIIDAGNRPGVLAAYARLAGDKAKFDDIIEDIRKAATNENAEAFEIRQAVDALLLNGKTKMAIEIITDRKREMALAFDLLCAQMRHKEAFALVDEARGKDTPSRERKMIEIRRARMLHQLGEKDAAKQLFEKVGDTIDPRNREELRVAQSLIKAEARLGLADEALDHVAKCLGIMTTNGETDGSLALLEPIFGEDNKLLAMAWWNLMRQNSPGEKPGLAMKRIRDLLTGKLDKKVLDEWTARMVRKAEREAVKGEEERLVTPRNAYTPMWAVAQAYLASKDEKRAEEFFKKSAEATPVPQGWIRYGDFLMERKRYREAASAYGKAVQQSQQGIVVVGEPEVDLSLYDTLENSTLPTYLQGRALKLAGDEKEGNRLIEIAHWLPLGNEEVRAKLVDELNKRDWPEMARKEAEMVLKTGWYKHYTIGNVISGLARAAAKDKDYFKAADYYERCLVGCLRTGASFIEPTAYLIVPESVRVHRARGFLAQGKIAEALAEARANLEIMPGNVDLAIKLVPDLEKAGKKKEADAIYGEVKGAYDKLLKDYPNSGFGHNSIAWVMANCRRDLDEALKHSQKAVELEPKSAGYLDTLAEITFRKGNRAKALELMKKCSEMDPNNAYYRKQLARFKDQAFESPTPEEEDDD